MFLLTKSECAVPEDIHIQHPIHGQSLEIPNSVSSRELLKKTPPCGV